jgi:hypothetical protein
LLITGREFGELLFHGGADHPHLLRLRVLSKCGAGVRFTQHIRQLVQGGDHLAQSLGHLLVRAAEPGEPRARFDGPRA